MPSKQPFGARVPTFRKERRMRPFRGGTVKYGENKINSLSDAIDRTNSVYFYFYINISRKIHKKKLFKKLKSQKSRLQSILSLHGIEDNLRVI